MKRKSDSSGKFYIKGRTGVIFAIGAIVPIIICAYLAIRCIWPGADRTENLIAAVFTILSLCFLAVALVRELIINLRLIGPSWKYPRDFLLPDLARKLSQQAAGLEEAAALWHQTYRQLLVSKGYVENIVNAIGECLIAISLDGKIAWLNKAADKLLGYEKDELISKPFSSILPKAKRDLFNDFARSKKSFGERDISLITKSGENIPVSMNSSPLYDNDGEIIGMIAVATDLREKKALISELKQAKNNLERKVEKRTREMAEIKDFLESIIRSMTDVLIVVDEKNAIEEINEAGEKLLGYPRGGLKGEKLDKIVLEFPSENTDEARFVSKTGEEIPVSIKRSNLYDKEGRGTGSLIIARDIRNRLITESKMREASRMSALGQFAAGAAHEINNPLSIISSNSQYLIEKLWDVEKNNGKITKETLTELIQGLDLVRRYSLSCSSAIQRLLDFARGASELPQKKIIDIGLVISDTVNFLEPQFKLNGIGIVRNFSKGTFKLLGDFARLQQVFMNALLNASEATQRGGIITISTSKEPEFIRLDIEDNGSGIPPENLPRVFDPFFTTKKPGTGIGLGLSIVYSTMKEHGGTVDIKSEVGRGTTLTLRFPPVNE